MVLTYRAYAFTTAKTPLYYTLVVVVCVEPFVFVHMKNDLFNARCIGYKSVGFQEINELVQNFLVALLNLILAKIG